MILIDIYKEFTYLQMVILILAASCIVLFLSSRFFSLFDKQEQQQKEQQKLLDKIEELERQNKYQERRLKDDFTLRDELKKAAFLSKPEMQDLKKALKKEKKEHKRAKYAAIRRSKKLKRISDGFANNGRDLNKWLKDQK